MSCYRHLFIFVLCLPLLGIAQDTLTIVHQNALYYGVNFGGCNSLTNAVDKKNEAFKTIFQYAKPDILTLNEMSPSSKMQDSLLNNALNVDGISYYKKAPTTNVAGTDIINTVFYNSQKVALYSSKVAQVFIRDINVHIFYHINEKLAQGDTIFFACVVAHLKAGNTQSDLDKKNTMVKNTMDWLSKQTRPMSYFFMGDFNFYTAEEPAFITMTTYDNEAVRFYDPVNQIGKWSDNKAYSLWHTQSPRSVADSCASTGGMDDRFDFIMINNAVKTGSLRVQYLNGSYTSIGNDGNHLNKALNNPAANDLYPMEVVNAIVAAADHVPVRLKVLIETDKSPVNIYADLENAVGQMQIKNPVKEKLDFELISPKNQKLHVLLCNELGQVVFTKSIQASQGENHFEYVFPGTVTKGIYLLRLSSQEGGQIFRKLVIY